MNESEREKEREKIKNEEIFENQPIDTYPVWLNNQYMVFQVPSCQS